MSSEAPPGARTRPAWRPRDPVGHRARGDERAAGELFVRPGQRAGAYRVGTGGTGGRPVPGGGHRRVHDRAVRTTRPPAGRGVPPRVLRRRSVPALPGRLPPPRGQCRPDPVARRRHHRRCRPAHRGRTAPAARDRDARRRSRDAGLPGEGPRGRPDPLGRADLSRRRGRGRAGGGRHLPRRPRRARGRRSAPDHVRRGGGSQPRRRPRRGGPGRAPGQGRRAPSASTPGSRTPSAPGCSASPTRRGRRAPTSRS